MRRHATPFLLALALAAALGTAPPAHGATDQLSIMQDDDQLLHRGVAARENALGRMQALGVDVVRVTVLWRDVAPVHRRARFRGENPRSYPHRRWNTFDGLVRSASARGLRVYLQPTGPGPRWAMGTTSDPRLRATYRPNPREFYKFVAAVGRRYSGSYRDEDTGRRLLPRVGMWSLYNEPNQGGWLSPQYAFDRTAGKVIPMAPVLYRELYLQGRKALADTGHDGDLILIGDTAPMGSSGRGPLSSMRPKAFIRELLCVARDGTPYTGRAARARRCRRLQALGPLRAGGWAHHPYPKNLPPTRRDSHRDSITMANVSELGVLLDRLAATTHQIAPGLPVFLTEFGYETNPPDPFRRFTPAQQAAFINVADFLAWGNPRVRATTQFLLEDSKPLRRFRRRDRRRFWLTYQSGLYFSNGAPKPAAYAYALPLVVTPTSDGTVSVWGQLRFLPDGTESQVALQWRPPGGGDFQTIGAPVDVADPSGYFTAEVPSPGPGVWRAEWTSPDEAQWLDSREVVVSDRGQEPSRNGG